jgi:iron complex outermembrane receptor protein
MAQAKKPGGDFISYYILDQLKHSLSLDLTHRIWKGFYASWVTSLRNRAGAYTDPQSGLETAYRTYLLLDAKVGWDRGPANFFISVDNLLNADYRDFGAIPMPGRWLSVGFSFAIQ